MLISQDKMLKYDFSLKTRDGHQIVNVQLQGRNLADAERKLRQMYHHCEVLSCTTTDTDHSTSRTPDIEDLLTLIAKQQ